MNKVMNIKKISSEEIISLFENSFEEGVAKLNGGMEFNVQCNDRRLNEPVQITVDISGYAGTPTIDEFRNGSVEGSDTVTIQRDDIGYMEFKLLPNLTCFLSGNDYQIVYKADK